MANLFQPSVQRAIDANGNTVSGARMDFFLTGTTTPATWFTDADGLVPGTNPLTADSGGKFPTPAYLDKDTVYRVRLTQADGVTLVWPDVDPVRGYDEAMVISHAVAAEQAEASTLAYRNEAEGFKNTASGQATAAAASATTASQHAATALGAADDAESAAEAAMAAGRVYNNSTEAFAATTDGQNLFLREDGNLVEYINVSDTTLDPTGFVMVGAAALEDVAAIGNPIDEVPGSLKTPAFRFVSDDDKVLAEFYTDGTARFAIDEGSTAWAQIGAVASVTGSVLDKVSGSDANGSPAPKGLVVAFSDANGQALFGAADDGSTYIGKYDARLLRAVQQTGPLTGAPAVQLVEQVSDQIVAWRGDVTVALTSEGQNQSPMIAGNEILFKSNRFRSRWAGYRMALDGSNQRPALRRKRFECFAHYGQSLAGGQSPILTFNELNQGAAYMLSGGPVFVSSASTASAVITGLKSGGGVETMAPWLASSLINYQSVNLPDLDVLMLGNTWPGQPYSVIKKGTTAYNAFMAQITRAVSQAGTDGLILRGVIFSHGENDAGSATYAADLAEIQNDLETDIRAITGQAEPVYMFVTQLSSMGNSAQQSVLKQLEASVANPKIILTGPDYIFPYVDNLHPTSVGARFKAEYVAKAVNMVVYQGRDWRSVTPRSWTLGSNYIDMRFWVPVTPLVLDTALATDPGNYGFTYSDAAGRTISSVAVQSPDTIRITLSGAIGAAATLAYAYANGTALTSGPTGGSRGCLRDSDPALSRIDGTTHLYNPGATFRQALN